MTQIRFLKKNLIDLDKPNITITVTDTVATDNGQTFVDYIRNRKNTSAWLTTGSTDAANTTLVMGMGDVQFVDRIILIGHNFKAFTIKYWTGAAWADFSTPIAETVNTDSTTSFSFTQVSTDKVQIIITGAQTVDADKSLKQLVITEDLAQLVAYPEISKPTHVSNRQTSRMLSGKLNILEAVGRFKVTLKVKYWSSDADLTAVESIYFDGKPVLLWLCGGDETQFRFKRVGYRLEDTYLVRPTNDYTPEFVDSVYSSGIKLSMRLEEVVD